MQWSSFSEFVSMGGYGVYVWGSYAVTFVLIAIEVAMVIKRKRAVRTGNGRESKPETRNPHLETGASH
ncbi:MAG TPA: heme exporter protein CcmD [Pyrinomonadaceae bacterium]|nr:heme exporter protein CcmD [Pyrinomonadaceae bacterium]